jgi:hypothetical protein
VKTRLQKSRKEQGTILMVSLFISFLFGMFLYSYLNSVQDQKRMIARSHAWNSALTLAEGGVEEALAQLNPGAPQPVIDKTANGWGAASGGLYGPISRSLSSGSYSAVFTTDTNPVIYATGYVTIPALSTTLKRVLRVGTSTAPLFSVAMGSRNGIDLKGNNVSTDSFNSALAALSTNGKFDPSKTSTNGDIASIAGLVNVGNANVTGSLNLGPTATDSVSKNGFVQGGVFQDFNVEFEDVVLPPNSSSWVPAVALKTPQVINGVSYQYVFGVSGGNAGGDYTINSLNANVYVATNTTVRLKLTGSATAGTIEVDGSGAGSGKLSIWMDGPSFTLSGNDVVDGGSAANFAYYGTTNNTQISFTGNAAFIGTIYAPEADIKLGGGGKTAYDFIGAVIGNTITMNGHFNFHYDENLLAAGPARGFVATSWREL